MTPEQQKLALLEWAGWKKIEAPLWIKDEASRFTWSLWEKGDKRLSFDLLPNLSSLDTIAEFEGKLNTEQQDKFAHALGQLTGGARIDFGATRIDCTTKIVFATATQRLEALVRTLGLWK